MLALAPKGPKEKSRKIGTGTARLQKAALAKVVIIRRADRNFLCDPSRIRKKTTVAEGSPRSLQKTLVQEVSLKGNLQRPRGVLSVMEHVLRLLPTRPQPAVVRYATTTGLVGLCFLAVLGLQDRGGVLGFYVMVPAIFLASVLFDRSSGIYATALSAVLLYLLVKPAESLLPPQPYILPLLTFVLVALGLAIVSEGLRAAWDRAVAAERAKDMLLQELGHRTKNNLAMVISVLSLQTRSKTNPEVRLALEKAVLRIQAMASAHDHFQPFGHNGRVEMRTYLEDLCRHLGDTLRDVRPIAVNVDADEVYLKPEQAVPVGLIVNELVTNALKHAFPDDRSGMVAITLRSTKPSLTLIVEDNGIGCPPTRTERLGSRLIRLLAQQLGATITWQHAEPGCRVRAMLSRV